MRGKTLLVGVVGIVIGRTAYRFVVALLLALLAGGGAFGASLPAMGQEGGSPAAPAAPLAAMVKPDGRAGAIRETPTVIRTVGGGGDYATLKAAFDAINAGTLTGAVQLNVIGDTTETAGAVLNASGSGSASYTSVLIQPSGGAARTISGDLEGQALLALNGADNVTIDGLNSGGNALTLSNIDNNLVARGTATLKFYGGASNNTITNATLLGSAIGRDLRFGATVWFEGTDTTTGNDDNVISHCNIGPAGANVPSDAILVNSSGFGLSGDNNVIDGNNIYDYFDGFGPSHGIYLFGISRAWTISNNRFYQTAPRTQSNGNLHAAIQVDSLGGNDGHIISNNTIGYASAAGTGTYNLTFVGPGTGRFLGIYYTRMGGGATTTIQGNTITAIAITTASPSRFSGIEIFNGPVLGEFNISNNTIGSLVTPDAITFTSTAAAGAELYGIRYVVPYNVNMSHNNVGGITASSSSGGVIRLTGLLARSIESETNSMVGNTVGSTAAPISNNASASGSQTIGLHCQVGKCSLTNNEIGNLTMNGANTGLRAGTSLVGMMVDSPASLWSSDVSNNTIHSLSHTHPSADVAVSGLYYRGTGIGSLGGNVSRNLIYGISTSSSGAGASVTGIDIDGPAIYNVFTNNMIALGGDMTANSPQIFGFSERFGGTGNDLQFNSVYIGGSGVASGSGSSAALFSTVANSTRTYRNNIFVNARSNGAATGKHYAVTLGGTTFNPTGLTSNNNVLFASGVGGVTGFFNGAERATLASWQAATGQDADSFAADPNFLAPSASVPDLHINPTVLSVIEGNGFSPDLWALDFDGETRSTLTPVDIGADAGNFIGADLLRPRIVYTPLANTQSMSNRALGGVAITDKSGVNTAAGSKPRVYYKRSTDGNVWNDNTPGTDGWKYAEANGASSPFDFTIDYARLNGGTGVSLGATVQYFVVAQDLAAVPNVGINSGLFASAPTSVALTTAAFPVSGAINSYQITQNFAGVYSVPGMFPSLTNAGGIFQAMQVGQLTGNVVIEITADLTGETGQFSLTQLAEAPAGSNFTVTIKPSGAARTITAAETARWVIRLAGADRVTIDGSLNGGDDRSLTISNPNPGAGSPSVVLLVSLGVGAGATNNTIKNCIIVGGSVGSSSVATFGIGSGGVGALQGPDNDNLTIRNNVIRRVRFGIQAFGGASAPNDNLQIVGNILGDDLATDSIGSIAMNIAYARNSTFSQNIVKNVANSYGSPYGIRFVDGVLSSSAMRNNITGIRHTGAGGFGGVGIELTAQSGANQVTLANNFISDIGGDGSNNALANGIAGIRLLGSGSGVSLYYNSVNLGSGSFGGNANGTQSAALAVSNSLAGLDIRNNIFATNLVNTNAPGAKTYAILTTATSGGVFGAINHNDYYVTGAQGVLGRLNSIDRTTLADWQTASGQDANSIAANPFFISPTDLRIDPTALRLASPVANAGTPIAGITDDFEGGPRDAITPDIGGDEIGSALAVTLVDFNAAQVGDLVQVTWETVSEIDNAGFNLYRTGSVGDRPELSDLLTYVASQAPGSTQGASYSFEDADVQPGQTYWYWLEDVDLAGATTLHGPVSATVSVPTAVTLAGFEAAAGGTTSFAALALAAGLAAAGGLLWRRRRLEVMR